MFKLNTKATIQVFSKNFRTAPKYTLPARASDFLCLKEPCHIITIRKMGVGDAADGVLEGLRRDRWSRRKIATSCEPLLCTPPQY